MNTPSTPRTVLVLGATGKTGRRIVDRLAGAGHLVRAGSRHPAAVADGARSDAVSRVEPVRFDWDDERTHRPALEGADAVYVIPPAFVVDHVAQDIAFFDAARAAGVRRAVLLSARGVDADDTIPLRRAELALFDSGLDASVIRPSWFAQNFTEGTFAEGVQRGVVATSAGDGLEPFIDADDIADVAAALLVSSDHAGTAFDLSGSQPLSFGNVAELLSDALGRRIVHQEITDDEFVAGAVTAGIPADYATMLASLFGVIRNGWSAHPSDGVERVLGRPARSFEQWVAASVA